MGNSNIHYHRRLDAIVVITAKDGALTGLDNFHVYSKSHSNSAYALKKHLYLKPSGCFCLTYIAGDYGDSVVGVCTNNGMLLGRTDEKITACVIDINEEQIRPLMLPYEDLKRKLNNDKQSFKYLQFMVCGEYVILQHNCYSRSPVYGPGTNSIQLTSGIYLYKIKSLGLFFKLEYFQEIPHESLKTIEYLSAMDVLQPLQKGHVLKYLIYLSDGKRKCQCDPEDSIHITQFSRHQGYNQTRDVVISTTGKGLSSLDEYLYRSLTSFQIWSRHTILGASNYAFVRLDLASLTLLKLGGNITLFQIKFHPGFCCNAKSGRREFHDLMKIPDHFDLFLDTRDRLIAWPKKRIRNTPVFAKVLENVQTG
jgi:hypothetical protein